MQVKVDGVHHALELSVVVQFSAAHRRGWVLRVIHDHGKRPDDRDRDESCSVIDDRSACVCVPIVGGPMESIILIGGGWVGGR